MNKKYLIAGVTIESPWEIPAPPSVRETDIILKHSQQLGWVPDDSELDKEWFYFAIHPSGSQYLRWRGIGEFLISVDGREIECRLLMEFHPDLFAAYLLNQVLSSALTVRRVDLLHGTAVAKNGKAHVFLGQGGAGKTTLTYGLLNRGYQLITDDLVRIDGRFGVIHPGLRRLKVCADTLRFMNPNSKSAVALAPFIDKYVVPIDETKGVLEPLPVQSIFIVNRAVANERVSLKPLQGANKMIQLMAQTYNSLSPRSFDHHFHQMGALAKTFPLTALRAPHKWENLDETLNELERLLDGAPKKGASPRGAELLSQSL
jgi:hypothetical protein